MRLLPTPSLTLPEPVDQKRKAWLTDVALQTVVGALSAAATTGATTPRAGLLVGGAATAVLAGVVQGVQYQRSRSERRRLDNVAKAAISELLRLDAQHKQLRQDWFYDGYPGEVRLPAEEVYEHIVRTAVTDARDIKAYYYGLFLARLAYRPDIDEHLASTLISVAAPLSERQLFLLTIGYHIDVTPHRDKDRFVSLRHQASIDDIGIYYDLLHLQHVALLGTGQSPRAGSVYSDPHATMLGRLLCETMGLDTIPIPDVLKYYESIESILQ